MSQVTEHLTFSNEKYHIKAEKLPGCQIKLDIEITPHGSKEAYKAAIKRVKKEVSLPGFRKGKAPDATITENYGKYIDQEWNEIVIQSAFEEGCELVKIYPLSKESIKKPKIGTLSKETGGSITFEWEYYPEIPTIDPKQLTLKKINPEETTEDDVKNLIEQVQLYNAEWTIIEDRPVEAGDFVNLTIENMDHPGTFICQDTRFEVNKEKMGQWMYDLVIGHKTSDVVEGTSEAGPEVKDKSKFISTKCKITINLIEKPKLPEINDELAKKVGASDVADLYAKAKESAIHQAKEEAKQKTIEEIEKLIELTYVFEIPQSLLNSQIKAQQHGTKKNLKQLGKSNEEIEKYLEENKDSYEKEALAGIRYLYLITHLARTLNIHVSQDEIRSEMIRQLYSSADFHNSDNAIERLKEKVTSELVDNKVMNYILENITYTE